MINKSIILNTKFRGIHCWSNCPFEKVQFLKNEHHHEFEVQMEVFVTDSDRQFEFIRMQQLLQTIIHNLYPNYNDNKLDDVYNNAVYKIFPDNKFVPYIAYLENKSCEMIAEDIINCFKKVCPNDISIIISEDGHYAGKVQYKNQEDNKNE